MISVYKILKTVKEVKQLIENCKKTKYCSHDYETTGLKYYSDDELPLIMGVSFQPGSAWIIPLAHRDSPFKKNWKKVIRLFWRGVLEDESIVKIAWNYKFEKKWHYKLGICPKGRNFDAMLAKYCLDEERPHGLKDFTRAMFSDFANYELSVKGKKWGDIELDTLSKYCGLDCDLTLRGYIIMEPKLISGGFYRLFRNLLMMGSWVLAESEYRGMFTDRKYLEGLMTKYSTKIAEVDNQLRSNPAVVKFEQKYKRKHLKALRDAVQLEIQEINQDDTKTDQQKARLIANRQNKIKGYLEGKFNNKEKYEGLNFSSPQQMIKFLYTEKFGLRLPVVEYTRDQFKRPTSTPSTAEATLLKLKPMDKAGFIDLLLEHRGLSKLNSTYIAGMYPLLSLKDRIHANFKLHGTVTGRLSCDEPNLQNIPRDTTSSDIKKMFIAPKGYVLLEVDYSQAELRVVAELANDKAMIDIFKRNYNIHVATACKVNGALERYDEIKAIIKKGEAMDPVELQKPENKKILFWVKQKKRAKTLNFGILYEQGDEQLAEGMGCTKEEAKEFKAEWFKAFPAVKKWINNQHKLVKQQGYVMSIFGRKRRLYNIYDQRMGVMMEAQRQSVNAPIQASASDFGLLSQIVIREKIRTGEFPKDIQQVYTVHDSIGYYIQPKYLHKVVPEIIKICANPDTKRWFGFELKKVNMKVSPEVGLTWGDLHEYDPKEDYTKLIQI